MLQYLNFFLLVCSISCVALKENKNCNKEAFEVEWEKQIRILKTPKCVKRKDFIKLELNAIQELESYYRDVGALIFDRIDTDSSRRLNQTEAFPYMKIVFSKKQVGNIWTKYFNGSLDKPEEEVRRNVAIDGYMKLLRDLGGLTWDKLNTKKDKCLMKEEFTSGWCKMMMTFAEFFFRIYDTDDDNKVTKAEYTAYHKRLNLLPETVVEELFIAKISSSKSKSFLLKDLQKFTGLFLDML